MVSNGNIRLFLADSSEAASDPRNRWRGMMSRMTNNSGTLIFLSAAVVSGCARIDNDRLTVGGEALPAIGGGVDDPLLPAAGPSVVNGSREHWERASIVVGVDGTEHHPHFTSGQPNYSRSPRACGMYPERDSAAALGGPAWPLVWEGVAAPFHAAAEVILFIPRMFDSPPCGLTRSPVDSLERYREGASPMWEPPELTPERAPIPES